MALSLGLILVNWIIRTFIIQQISYRKKDLKILVRRFILLIQYLLQCMVLLQVKLRYLKWKHVQTKLFVPCFQTKSIVLYFLNTALILFMTIS